MTYIDLGLPSGNLWCDCNYGTNIPTEAGKYFTFEEVEGFMGNKEELIPTKDDFQELLDYCKWEQGSEGYKVIGPNGNSIFLPAAGWRNAGGFFDVGKVGFYWSSTPNNSNVCGLRFRNEYCLVDWLFRSSKHSVRRIKKVNKMKEVKIEIPEGYIIDKENSTFECIKFKKKEEEIEIHKVATGVRVKTPNYDFTILDKEDLKTDFNSAFKLAQMHYCRATIPTIEQWKIIYKNLYIINPLLCHKIEEDVYWTSDVCDNSSFCLTVNMHDCYSYSYYRCSASMVRPIINLV